MKKAIITVLLGFCMVGISFAQNKLEAMNFLTINALMRYGQQLYSRGDFYEASAVFKHVLTYDAHQPQALHYLKEIGELPLDPSDIQGMKKAIEVKKKSIEQLQSQIMHMQESLDP